MRFWAKEVVCNSVTTQQVNTIGILKVVYHWQLTLLLTPF